KTVRLMPAGKVNFLAYSDSRGVELTVGDCGGVILRLLLLTGVDGLDDRHDLSEPLRQRGKVTSRRRRVLDRLGDARAHGHHELARCPRLGCLRDRLGCALLGCLLAGRGHPQRRLTGCHEPPPAVEKGWREISP